MIENGIVEQDPEDRLVVCDPDQRVDRDEIDAYKAKNALAEDAILLIVQYEDLMEEDL